MITMFKTVFVMYISLSTGGINTDLQFKDAASCENARHQIAVTSRPHFSTFTSCVKMDIPLKKTKCKIINKTDYYNSESNRSYRAVPMNGYPYPVEMICEEQ